MMTPAPRSSMPGSNPRSRRTAQSRLPLRAESRSSSVSAAKPPPGAVEPPTLLMRMSTPPRRARTSWTTFSAPSAVLRSA